MLVNTYSFFFQLFNILLTFSTMAHFTNFISNASRADSSLLMLESAKHVSDTHKKLPFVYKSDALTNTYAICIYLI